MGEKACSACRAWGAAGLLQGMAGLRLAWTHCGLAKPPTSGRAGTGAGRAVGRRLVLAAGGAFDSKHQTRQVSPVSQPDLEAGSQPALYPIAPAHPLNPSVPSLAKTNPPPHLALKVPIPALPCRRALCPFPRHKFLLHFFPRAWSQGGGTGHATLFSSSSLSSLGTKMLSWAFAGEQWGGEAGAWLWALPGDAPGFA